MYWYRSKEGPFDEQKSLCFCDLICILRNSGWLVFGIINETIVVLNLFH